MGTKWGQARALGTIMAEYITAELEQESRNPGLSPKAHCPGHHVSRSGWNSIWGSALATCWRRQKVQKDQTNSHNS